VKKVDAPVQNLRVATFLGLVTTSLACLCAGALVAVTYEGLPRLLFAAAGFCGYLFFFAHGLRALALPGVLIESRPEPDGEARGETVRPNVRVEARQRGVLRTAA
jgi:uncharacterized protein (DUF58 family)